MENQKLEDCYSAHSSTVFSEQRTNDIIACDECLIQNKESNAVIQRVKELFVKYDIKP